MQILRSSIGWLLCAALGVGLHATDAFGWLDRRWLDWEFNAMRAHFQQPARSDVVLVGIDEEFLRAAAEPQALMHLHYAQLFEAVAAGKPRLSGLDMVLPEKSFSFLVPVKQPELDFDRELARGLLKLGAAAPLVIGEIWDNGKSRFRNIHPAFAATAGFWVSQRGPAGFNPSGSALVCPDADGVVRKYPGAACQPGGATRTLVGQMASLLGRRGDVQGYINYAVGAPFRYVSARDVVAWHQAGDGANLAQLTDKVVLIGAVLDNEDRRELPVSLAQWEPGNRLLPGLVLQGQMLRSVMNHGLVQAVPSPAVWVLIVLAAVFWFGRSLRWKALGLLAFTGLLGAVSLLALHANLFLPVGAVLATAWLAFLASAAGQGRSYWKERQYLTQTFSGYVSPQVLKGILSGTLAAGKAGQRQWVCVLFSDIRGFTTLSENLPAEQVVVLLNQYFDSMARIVHQHGGLVDKFMGDGMMALFGVPNRLECPERSALEAARDMLLALEALNSGFRNAGLPVISIGIGVHAGEAVIGHLGSRERHEYTAIGDAVNVAARVCDLPKTLGYPIICTASVASAVGFAPYLQEAGVQALKGHSDMQVYGWNPANAPSPH